MGDHRRGVEHAVRNEINGLLDPLPAPTGGRVERQFFLADRRDADRVILAVKRRANQVAVGSHPLGQDFKDAQRADGLNQNRDRLGELVAQRFERLIAAPT